MSLMGKKIKCGLKKKKTRKLVKPPFERKRFLQTTLRRGNLKEWNIFKEFLGQFLLEPCDYPSPPAINTLTWAT